MSSADKARLLSRLLAKLAGPAAKKAFQAQAAVGIDPQSPEASAEQAAAGPDIFHGDPVLREFVRSFLLWESTTAKADAAMKKIASQVVDINEFRVSLPSEMAAVLGPGYSRVEERVVGLRAALNDVFKREHRLRMTHVPAMSKKQAQTYLTTLDRTPAFVADRVALLCCQAHVLPLDSRITAVLVKAKVIDKDLSGADPKGIERLIKAGDARNAYELLQQAADAAPFTPTKAPRPAKAKRPATPRKQTASRSKVARKSK